MVRAGEPRSDIVYDVLRAARTAARAARGAAPHGARDLPDTEMGCGCRWCGDRCCHRTVFPGCAAGDACRRVRAIQVARYLGQRSTIASCWLRSLVGEPGVRWIRFAWHGV